MVITEKLNCQNHDKQKNFNVNQYKPKFFNKTVDKKEKKEYNNIATKYSCKCGG